MRYYKPIEIAKELEISTSALRHYESWGVVPLPERAKNGYRLYTKVHLAYFRCLRAMIPGFGFTLTYDVLRHIQNADMDHAFWLVNVEQAKLHEEKSNADQTLVLLQDPKLTTIKDKKIKNLMTIGEVAGITNVQTSAIRHWEKEGLLFPERAPENGYRLYTPVHVRQILLICNLRKTVYYLEKMKELVQAVEHHSIEKIKEVTENALISIHRRNRQQFNGVHKLMELCIEVGLMGYNEASLLKPNHSFDMEKDK
ncbi:MerR family transcriptional regulator [Paenibacillus sp. LMG 31460]|uniref:MerR family transcriptional regulator n=1 Tax=Paenibacillus germinis TaxID=2654979 RepID=A0ABX1Z5X2_9BACL|nr:TioE family transcriptional regulator [Paenibacillus germinis]NOU87308.1 MerR family transcriptional regulator [Paenibacillus germinis]